jgi:iron complex outermembrane receptor protein
LHFDAQYSTASKNAEITAAVGPLTGTGIGVPVKVDRWSGSAGGSLELFSSWVLRYDIASGEEVENDTVDYGSANGAGLVNNYSSRITSRLLDQNLGASGDLFALPAGSVKLAAGVSYRTEAYSLAQFQSGATDSYDSAHQDVSAGYGEILFPLFSESNAAPGLKKLTLSAAVRRDHYSDFGHTTNPKYGLSWFPVDTLELRAAYSTSFRAPATGNELIASKHGASAIGVYSVLSPDQTTSEPAVYLLGATPHLRPETARNVTVGFDYKPLFAPGLRLSFNYYDIAYSAQIAAPPFDLPVILSNPALAPVVTHYSDSTALQAIVNSTIQAGATYFDFTGGAFGPNPLATAVYSVDVRTQNLSSTDTSGFDFSARYPFVLGADRIDTQVNVAHIDKFSSELTAASPALSQVNTVGYPARLRLRGQGTWTHEDLNISMAVNYVGGYPDTSAVIPRDVGSFTTLDLVARYDLSALPDLHGVIATIAATNILNRYPPYVETGTSNYPGAHYDSANADPTGRFIAATLAKRW